MCDSVLIYCVSHHDYHVHTSITYDSVIQRSEDESCFCYLLRADLMFHLCIYVNCDILELFPLTGSNRSSCHLMDVCVSITK